MVNVRGFDFNEEDEAFPESSEVKRAEELPADEERKKTRGSRVKRLVLVANADTVSGHQTEYDGADDRLKNTFKAIDAIRLNLGSLSRDVERAGSSLGRNHFSAQLHEEVRMHAVRALNELEGVITEVSTLCPQETHLLFRIKEDLANLKQQAIKYYRAFLANIGWPLPLSTSTSANPGAGRIPAGPNPLLTMQGDLKLHFCENFLLLCCLQKLQITIFCQLEGRNREIAVHGPLWAIEELVNTVSHASKRHFWKWIDKPEFIFAPFYEIIRDYVDSMDKLLQPLVDEAMLSGYSCREEWIALMVSALSIYLAEEIFPLYARQLEEERGTGNRSEARTSYLDLIHWMIWFDKKMRSLIANSGIPFSLMDERNLQKFSTLSVFSGRLNWLMIWAELELSGTMDELKSIFDDERNWTQNVRGAGDNRTPPVSDFFVKHLSSVVHRSRLLPTIDLRRNFFKAVGVPIIREFWHRWFVRCLEGGRRIVSTDDSALIRLANSVNAARHVESVLREWSDNVFFIELTWGERDEPIQWPEGVGDVDELDYEEGGYFSSYLLNLRNFSLEMVNLIAIALFDEYRSSYSAVVIQRDYRQINSEEALTMSRTWFDALDLLQGKISMMEECLNRMDFVRMWREVAERLDGDIFRYVLLMGVRCYSGAVEKLGGDMEVLFGVFRTWCLRPEGFFPTVYEGLKLVRMGERQLRDILAGGDERLNEEGITHLYDYDAEEIARCWVFTS